MAAADVLGGRPSARELLRAFRDRQLRPDEVAEDALRRIEGLNPVVNAFVTVDPGQVRAAAAESTERYRAGTARPLEGLPVAVKDLIDAAGLRTTCGSAIFREHLPAGDAGVVRALRAAGGIVLGKTATHEFAWGITTDGAAYGPTRNPWDPSRTAGGSSGGSAAAVAAGLAPLALGTDTVGSVRIPAAFCGVVGFRPTFAAIDRAGVFPLAPALDSVGIIAATVEDARLLWRVLGPSRPGPARPGPTRPPALAGLRVGAGMPAEPGPGQRAVSRLGETLGRHGVATRPLDLPGEQALAAAATFVGFQGLREHRERGLWPARRADYGPDVAARLAGAERLGADDYAAAQLARTSIRQRLVELLDDLDVIVSPVSLAPPVALAEHDAEVIARFRRDVMSQTALASLVGAPAVTIPVGLDDDGLPLGVQLMAAPGHDDLLLGVAAGVAALLPPAARPALPPLPALS